MTKRVCAIMHCAVIKINKAKVVQMSDCRCLNCQLKSDLKVAINGHKLAFLVVVVVVVTLTLALEAC